MKNLLLSAIFLGACDLAEGEAEERREVSQAVRRGASPERIERQLQDVGDTIAKEHAQDDQRMHQSLDEIEVRLAAIRQQLQESKVQPDVGIEVQLVEISEAAAAIRQSLREAGDSPAARRSEELRRELVLLHGRLDQLSSSAHAQSDASARRTGFDRVQ